MNPFRRLFSPTSIEELQRNKDVSRLVKILRKDDASTRRFSAARALREIADAAAVKDLIAVLDSDSDWRVRGEAALALGKIADPRAVPTLIQHLGDEEGLEEAHRKVAEYNRAGALGQDAWGPYGAPDSYRLNDALRGDPPVYDCCMTALHQIGLPSRDALLACLYSTGTFFKLRRAGDLLCLIDRSGILDAILPLTTHPNELQKRIAADVLAQSGDPRAVIPLLSMLEAELSTTRPSNPIICDVLFALKKFHEPKSIPLLIRCLKYLKMNHEFGSDYCIDLLSRFGNIALTPLLPEMDTENSDHRDAVMAILIKIADKTAVEPLVKRLASESPDVRMNAAILLGAIGDPSAAEPVARLLGDQKPRVRRGAAEALGKIGDKQVLSSLTVLLNDTKSAVRDAARQAIDAIATRYDSASQNPL